MTWPARLGTLVAAALVAAGGLVVPSVPAHAAPLVPLRLISQSNGFNVAPDGTMVVIVEAPTSLPLATLADPDVIVTSYAAVNTRLEVLAAIGGSLPRALDTVDVALDGVLRPAPQQLLLTIPTESTSRTEAALQFPRAGLYPMVIDIRDGGSVVAELTTFVHRLPGPDDDPLAALNVTVAAGVDAAVTIDPEGTPTLVAGALGEFADLASVLEASRLTLTVGVEPLALTAVERIDPSLAERLRRDLAGHQVLAGPLLPLDPSAAAAAGQQALYTEWLRDGETALDGQAIPNRRTIAFVDRPLSVGGAALLRDLGTRLLLLTPEIYDPLDGSYGPFTDTSQLVRVELGPGVDVAAAIVDRTTALAGGSPDPALSAVHLLAELLATRQQVADLGGDPRRHSIVLAAPGIGVPDKGLLTALATLLSATPGLQVIHLDDVGLNTDVLLVDGQEVTVRLPAVAGPDIGQRVATAGTLRFDAAVTGSMLPDGDPRSTGWERRIAVLPSSALADADVTRLAEGLHAEMAAIRAAVEPPPPFAFTLTGRKSAIRLRFRNTSDTPLTVRIRMSSAKLVFPDGDQLAVLAPDGTTEVDVRVEARTNGRFPVALQVLAPGGDVEIVPAVPLTARVNALTGLGNLITGAAVLVLLAWWGRHLGRNRRRKRTQAVAGRHPVNGNRPSGTPLSPDAEASSLPTS